MAIAALYGGLSIFQNIWNVPFLRIVFFAEIAAIVIGTAIGSIIRGKVASIVLISLGVIGLIAVFVSLTWGVASDAYILIPYVGEDLLLGSVLSLFVMSLKKRNNH